MRKLRRLLATVLGLLVSLGTGAALALQSYVAEREDEEADRVWKQPKGTP